MSVHYVPCRFLFSIESFLLPKVTSVLFSLQVHLMNKLNEIPYLPLVLFKCKPSLLTFHTWTSTFFKMLLDNFSLSHRLVLWPVHTLCTP